MREQMTATMVEDDDGTIGRRTARQPDSAAETREGTNANADMNASAATKVTRTDVTMVTTMASASSSATLAEKGRTTSSPRTPYTTGPARRRPVPSHARRARMPTRATSAVGPSPPPCYCGITAVCAVGATARLTRRGAIACLTWGTIRTCRNGFAGSARGPWRRGISRSELR